MSAGRRRPRVRVACETCGTTFEPIKASERTCAGCNAGGRIDAEEEARWRAFLEGYSLGWHHGVSGTPPEAVPETLAELAGEAEELGETWPERLRAGARLGYRRGRIYRVRMGPGGDLTLEA